MLYLAITTIVLVCSWSEPGDEEQEQTHAACTLGASSCAVTSASTQALHRVGIAPSNYVTYNLVLTLFESLVFLGVGGLIFWRKSSEPICLAASFVFVTIGLWPFFTTSTYPPAVAFGHISATYILPIEGYLLVTFPDGRFVPRRSWLLVVLWIVQTIVFQLPGPTISRSGRLRSSVLSCY